MRLSPEMGRILGVLIEKELTTPQQYPLSLNALLLGCNQTSNRNPVVSYQRDLVLRTVGALRQERLVIELPPEPGRSAYRYRQTANRVFELDKAAMALLGVLLLRGPQTAGELHARTDRMVAFDDIKALEVVLERLATRDDPLVRRLERRPGQKGERWRQLLVPAEETTAVSPSDRPPVETVSTRSYEVEVQWTEGSTDTPSRGDADRWSAEELLVASLAQSHMVWFLQLAADAGVVVHEYSDRPTGSVAVAADGSGRFTDVTLRPTVVVEDAGKVAAADGLQEKARERCFIAGSVSFPVHCRALITARASASSST